MPDFLREKPGGCLSNASSALDETRRDGSALPVQMIWMGSMAGNGGSGMRAVMRERGTRFSALKGDDGLRRNEYQARSIR